MTWKIHFGMAAAGMLLIGAATFILYPGGLKSPPAATYPKPTNAAEANLQDIDYLEQVVAVDRSFSPEAGAGVQHGNHRAQRPRRQLIPCPVGNGGFAPDGTRRQRSHRR